MVAADAATPDSRFVEIPGAGHLLPYDKPQELGAVARRFLLEVTGRQVG
jgi:pimeloyl-ACP methyl ester carboxylesterase